MDKLRPLMERRFKLSRLEMGLGTAVILGLLYMIYLFGFAGPAKMNKGSEYLDETAINTLTEIIKIQVEANIDTRKLIKLMSKLPKPPKRANTLNAKDIPESKLMAISKLLEELNMTNAMIESKLTEFARLLPPDKKTD